MNPDERNPVNNRPDPDELGVPSDPTEQLTTPGTPTGQVSPTTEPTVQVSPTAEPTGQIPTTGRPTEQVPAQPGQVLAPARPRGPHAPTVLLGLICLVVAALVIAYQSADITVDWSLFGPGAIIGAGVVLVLLGLVGVTRRER